MTGQHHHKKPCMPPPSALYMERQRAAHGLPAAPRPESMTRNNGPQTAPAAPRTSFELPEAEAFFAAGSGVGLCNRSPTWPRDAYYAFCTPLAVCCPTRNLCCSLSYNASVAATTCRSPGTDILVLRTGRRRSGGPASPRPAGRARRSLTRSFARASRSCSILAAWSCCRASSAISRQSSPRQRAASKGRAPSTTL